MEFDALSVFIFCEIAHLHHILLFSLALCLDASNATSKLSGCFFQVSLFLQSHNEFNEFLGQVCHIAGSHFGDEQLEGNDFVLASVVMLD